MEIWRRVWRRGLAPQLSDAGLGVLRAALQTDDPRLIQGEIVTTGRWPARLAWDRPAAGCVIGLCGWLGEGLETVGEVEDYFTTVAFAIDDLLGKPAACRGFLNWFDETVRSEVRRLLLPEVLREQARRSGDLPEDAKLAGNARKLVALLGGEADYVDDRVHQRDSEAVGHAVRLYA
mgnify:CR=1 FL=1